MGEDVGVCRSRVGSVISWVDVSVRPVINRELVCGDVDFILGKTPPIRVLEHEYCGVGCND